MNSASDFSSANDIGLIDIADLLRTLNRYKWSIVSITGLCVLVAALATFVMDPIYRGTATLMIEPTKEQVAPVVDVYDPGVGRYDYYMTQYQLLQSRDVATRVVEKLDLVHDSEFAVSTAPDWIQSLDWRKWLPFLAPAATPLPQEQIDAQRQTDVTDQFLTKVTIEPVTGTQLVHVSFDAHSPELSAKVANAIGDVYIESGLQQSLDVTRKANTWLTAKLADIRVQLEKSEKELQDFRDQQQLVSVGGERTISEDELLDANKRLRDAQRSKTELASAYWKIKQSGSDPAKLQEIGQLLADSRVARASDNFLAAQETVKQLLQRYGEKHPAMASAQARLDGARNAYYEQLRIAAEGVRTNYEIAEQTERSLNNVVGSARQLIKNLDKKQYEMSVLEREVSTNRDIYNTFLTRFKQTDTLDTSYQGLPAHVTGTAIPPRTRYSPSLKKYVAIAAVAGLMLGLLLALLRHLLSEEIRSAEELEALAQSPILGVLPLVPKEDRKGLATMFLQKPKSTFVEGIRSIRTAVQLSDVDKTFKRLLIASSVPQEGKSTLACNLAVSFAAMEQTLLIDADLRKPTVAASLGLPARAPGLTELLAGQVKLEDCLYLHQPSGLFVLPAGRTVPNPAEVLASNGFRALMEELSRRFSRVIFDSAPCQAASDALLLSSQVDRVIFVVKADSTSRRTVRSSLKLLGNVSAPLLGCVVDQVNSKKHSNFYHAYDYAASYYS